MSFFAKYTPAGSTPLAREKPVIKTAPAARRTVTPPTPDAASRAGIRPSKSTPNLKRARSCGLKPPPPASVSRSRSPRVRLESSSDDDDEGEDDDSDGCRSKRSKLGSASPMVLDTRRRMVHPVSFHTRNRKTGEPVPPCVFVHAEEIANTKLKNWGKLKEFRNVSNAVQQVGLHYPGIPQQERYQLARNSDPDEFNPVAEMFTTMECVATHLMQPELGDPIHSEVSGGGIVWRMRRALKDGDAPKFLEQLKGYNTILRQCRRDGSFKKRISGMITVPAPLVEHILSQAYARTVALQVEALRNYRSFTSEVYGELLPKFTRKIFKETALDSSKVFVDLGSGTGNVVLHAALECGCESWGCEKMPKPAELAAAQRAEFIARCRMWGLNHGAVHLEHDTFLENRNIAATLRRADVLLVNNFAFEPDLNQKLLDIFLDLKEGAVIVSLKPFVPANHVITTRNAESPVNRLRMVEREYFSREVSWTDAGGKYYIHTVDSSRLQAFFAKRQSR
ncbi:histone H3 methyltransferase [Geopyxis carbonaria]|nr:histone H3 methyltransferase [Geopyxis carbonaria]